MLQALLKEMDTLNLPGNPPYQELIETIYFGGGTPSLLTPVELGQLLGKIHQRFRVSGSAEITLEANPDDVTREATGDWKALGFNRLSIGIQSFRQEDLTWMNRAHNALQARHCIELAAAQGFTNINADLIYGTPTLDHRAWLSNLSLAAQSGIKHLSCYALTVEENTALHHFIAKGKIPPPAEEKQADQFELLMDWADAAGYEHYEISNLCMPGYQSRHNSNYWSGKAYLGFGPSAHSFDGDRTRWNGIANNALYIAAWLTGNEYPYETEVLNNTQRLNERIMTGLRNNTGVKVSLEVRTVEELPIPEPDFNRWLEKVKKFETEELCTLHSDRLSLTRKGKLYADHIASEIFF